MLYVAILVFSIILEWHLKPYTSVFTHPPCRAQAPHDHTRLFYLSHHHTRLFPHILPAEHKPLMHAPSLVGRASEAGQPKGGRVEGDGGVALALGTSAFAFQGTNAHAIIVSPAASVSAAQPDAKDAVLSRGGDADHAFMSLSTRAKAGGMKGMENVLKRSVALIMYLIQLTF